jgi:hypothetical protein
MLLLVAAEPATRLLLLFVLLRFLLGSGIEYQSEPKVYLVVLRLETLRQHTVPVLDVLRLIHPVPWT